MLSPAVIDRVSAAVDAVTDELVTFTSDLIRVPTVNPPGDGYEDCARLIGDLFTDKLRFPCPAATFLCLIYPDQAAAASRAGMKFMRTTSLSESRSARYLPQLREQAAEWREVQAQMQEGRRLVRAFSKPWPRRRAARWVCP